MGGRPKSKTVKEKRRRAAVMRKTRLEEVGLGGGGLRLGLRLGGGGRGLWVQRSGKSGGKKAKIMTQAERPTPRPTSEPSWARPGKPPKFRTRNALMVVTAA